MNPTKQKVIVAMSGGVDSSVAASLLVEQGYDVVGVTLKLLPRGGEGFGCCGSPDDVAIAKRSAEKAGVPHYVLDYSPDFEKNVINYFVDSYLTGETPNPCLACNRYIKFDKLHTFAASLDAAYLATGHYARVVPGITPDAPHRLFEAVDHTKDQSYVLYNIKQKALRSTMFPVGHATKVAIRELARKFELPNADKKDSQEICFVPNKDYRSFVQKKVTERAQEKNPTLLPGPIKDANGNIIGEHQGIALYTIGQRRGIPINSNTPVYVTDLDAATNTLVVGSDNENLTPGLNANDVSWVMDTPPSGEFQALVKIRYKHEPAEATVKTTPQGFDVFFKEPQRAVSPGQAAVIYRFDETLQAREVLGGGKIQHAIK